MGYLSTWAGCYFGSGRWLRSAWAWWIGIYRGWERGQWCLYWRIPGFWWLELAFHYIIIKMQQQWNGLEQRRWQNFCLELKERMNKWEICYWKNERINLIYDIINNIKWVRIHPQLPLPGPSSGLIRQVKKLPDVEGRDKFCKAIQYACRFLKYKYEQSGNKK